MGVWRVQGYLAVYQKQQCPSGSEFVRKKGSFTNRSENAVWFISVSRPFHTVLKNTQPTPLNSPMPSPPVSLKPQFKRLLWNFTGQKPYTSSQSISLTPEPSDKNTLSPIPLGLKRRFLAGNLLTSNNDLECLSLSAVPIFIHSIWATGGGFSIWNLSYLPELGPAFCRAVFRSVTH